MARSGSSAAAAWKQFATLMCDYQLLTGKHLDTLKADVEDARREYDEAVEEGILEVDKNDKNKYILKSLEEYNLYFNNINQEYILEDCNSNNIYLVLFEDNMDNMEIDFDNSWDSINDYLETYGLEKDELIKDESFTLNI